MVSYSRVYGTDWKLHISKWVIGTLKLFLVLFLKLISKVDSFFGFEVKNLLFY